MLHDTTAPPVRAFNLVSRRPDPDPGADGGRPGRARDAAPGPRPERSPHAPPAPRVMIVHPAALLGWPGCAVPLAGRPPRPPRPRRATRRLAVLRRLASRRREAFSEEPSGAAG